MLDSERLAVYGPLASHPIREYFSDSPGVVNVLARYTINTLGELMVRTPDELASIRGVAGGTIRKIKSVLGEHELYLREEWRNRADAIRYVYRFVPQAPAGVILRLSIDSADKLRRYKLVTLHDFASYSLKELSDMKLWGVDNPKQLIQTLVELRIIRE